MLNSTRNPNVTRFQPNDNNTRSRERKCFNCGKPGHIGKFCKHKMFRKKMSSSKERVRQGAPKTCVSRGDIKFHKTASHAKHKRIVNKRSPTRT